jgi:hypothetical protein
MTFAFRLGKLSAVRDARIKRMSIAAPNLPSPPLDANWFAAVSSWGMLGNDSVGDCVEAATLHCIQQFSTYAESPLIPTDAEALAFYEAATGYNPADPNTDQGSYVLGTGGTIQYWMTKGVTCGGQLNKATGFMQITQKNPTEWQQGIYLFGGLLTGLQLPEAIVAGDTVPFVWETFSGPVAGGHEVWINGYETLNSGRVYDLISWGKEYRATEEFLMNCVDEMVVVVDPAEISARGVDGANISMADLMSDITDLGSEE